MKTLTAGLVAVAILGATAAQAAVSVGINIGPQHPIVVHHRRSREVCHIVRHHGRVCHRVYY